MILFVTIADLQRMTRPNEHKETAFSLVIKADLLTEIRRPFIYVISLLTQNRKIVTIWGIVLLIKLIRNQTRRKLRSV